MKLTTIFYQIKPNKHSVTMLTVTVNKNNTYSWYLWRAQPANVNVRTNTDSKRFRTYLQKTRFTFWLCWFALKMSNLEPVGNLHPMKTISVFHESHATIEHMQYLTWMHQQRYTIHILNLYHSTMCP